MSEHELDHCECGDYRRDHPNNGPCTFNVLRGNGGLTHGFHKCERFKLECRLEPGLGWTLSDEARRDIEEIEKRTYRPKP